MAITSNQDLYQLTLNLIEKKRYLDALDKIKILLSKTPHFYHDLMRTLYQTLIKESSNTMVKMIIVELYIYKKEYNNAVYELEETFEDNPNEPNIYFYLSRIYSKSSEKKRIIQIFETAINKNILDSSIIDILPTIYIENHQLDKSINLYKKLIKQNPSNQFYLRTIADLYQKNNQFHESITYLQSLLKVNPDSKESILKECEVLSKLNPADESIAIVMVDLYLTFHQPQKILAIIYQIKQLSSDKREPLIKQLKKSIKVYPYSNEIKLSLAYLMIQKKQFSEAAYYVEMSLQHNYESHKPTIHNILSSIIKKHPQHVFTTELLMEAYYLDKKYNDCLTIIEHYSTITHLAKPRIYQILLDIEKDQMLRWAARKTRIQLLFNEKNDTLCLSECDTYLFEKKDPEIIEFKVKVLMEQKKLQEASQVLKDQLVNDPFSPIYHKLLNNIHIESIHKRISDPSLEVTSSKSLLELGLLNLRKSAIPTAIDYFQKITSPKKIHHHAQLLTGLGFIETGRFDKAIKIINRIFDQKPSLETIKYSHLLLGISYFLSGNPFQAFQELETISEYDINFPNLSGLIQSIKHHTSNDKSPVFSLCYHDNSLIPICTYQTLMQSPSDLAIHQHKKGIESFVQGRYETAKNEWVTASKIDDSFYLPYLGLSSIELINQNTEAALDWLNKVKNTPSNPAINYQRGMIHHAEQNDQATIQEMERCLEIDETFLPALVTLGDLLYKQNEIKSAFHYWINASDQLPYLFLIKRRSHYLYAQSLSPLKWMNEDVEVIKKRLMSRSKSISTNHNKPKKETKKNQIIQPSLFNFNYEHA